MKHDIFSTELDLSLPEKINPEKFFTYFSGRTGLVHLACKKTNFHITQRLKLYIVTSLCVMEYTHLIYGISSFVLETKYSILDIQEYWHSY